MKLKYITASLILIGGFALAGCSGAEEPEEVPTPIATVSIPEGSGTPTEAPTTTPEPSPTPTNTTGIPDNGVDPNGLNRDEGQETEYLNVIGFSHDSPREVNGKTSVEIIAEGEGTAKTRNYYLNIGYQYCALALEDTVSEPKALFNRLLGDLAKRLDRTVEDPVIQNGYSPVLNMALGTLCPERWQ